MVDKTSPGAWNLLLIRYLLISFTTAGLVIDPTLHEGFRFEVVRRAQKDFPFSARVRYTTS